MILCSIIVKQKVSCTYFLEGTYWFRFWDHKDLLTSIFYECHFRYHIGNNVKHFFGFPLELYFSMDWYLLFNRSETETFCLSKKNIVKLWQGQGLSHPLALHSPTSKCSLYLYLHLCIYLCLYIYVSIIYSSRIS
jgi:hypothetical protein